MTDYKNELHVWLEGYKRACFQYAAQQRNPENKALVVISEKEIKEYEATFEALLSQHSKKRELEAYDKGYADGYNDQANDLYGAAGENQDD